MNGKMRVGFVGVGMMGKPMASRILKAGYPLTVYDIRPEAVKEFVGLGAKSAKSAKEIAEVSDICFTSLPSIAAWEDVYFGSNGLLKGARKGEILVDTSTVAPSLTRKIYDEAKKQGVEVMDAALQSGTLYHEGLFKLKANEVVERGQVTVMVGGDPETVEKARPVIASFGDPIIYFGPVGSGELIKVVGNAMTHAAFAMLCEFVAVAMKSGIDVKRLLDYLAKISSMNRLIEYTIPSYMESGKGRMMRLEPCLKDCESMLQVAKDCSMPMLFQSITNDYYLWAESLGSKDLPWDEELMKVWEGLIGKPVRSVNGPTNNQKT